MTNGNQEIKSIKLLITILPRGMADEITTALNDNGIRNHIVFLGHGTASKDILEYLNLSETEKEIVMTSVSEEDTEKAFDTISKVTNLKKHGTGIAFTVPIRSVGGLSSLKLLANLLQNQN